MGDWIKIGYTAGEPARRIAQLQTGQPQRIKLLGTIPGDMDAESGLHTELAPFRGSGEWFEGSGVRSVVDFLIKAQHPWYFCRTYMFDGIWERAFKPTPKTDLSAYDDYQVHKITKKVIPEEKRKKASIAFARRLNQLRKKHGIDPDRENNLRRCFFGTSVHPYILAWTS